MTQTVFDPESPQPAQTPAPDQHILLAAKGGGIGFAGNLFAYGGRLLIGILLTRLLGAEQYGLYSLALTAGEMAAGFALLGLGYALVRYVSLYASQHDTPRLWGTLQVGLGLTTLVSLLVGASLFVLARPVATYWFHEPRLASLLRLAVLLVPLLALTEALVLATRGFNKMQYGVIAQQTVQPLARLLLVAALALAGLTAANVLTAFIVAQLITCVLLLFFLNGLFPLRRPWQTARRDVKGMLRFSLPVHISTLIDTFGGNLYTILLGSLGTVRNVGVFVASAHVSTLTGAFNQAVGSAASPIVSELDGSGNREQMARFYRATTHWMFSLNLPVFLLVVLFPRSILALFGNDFVEGAAALSILVCAKLVEASVGIADGILNMTGNTQVRLLNSVVTLALTVGLSSSFISRWGVLGAAAAVLATTTLISLLRLVEVFLLLRMLPGLATFLKPAAAGLAALGVGWTLRNLLHTQANLILVAINALAILLVYMAVLLLLGLSPEDYTVLARVQSRLRSLS